MGSDLGATSARARILVVEDDARLARLVVEQLGHGGYQAEAVGLGEDALARASASAFDLVVLDLNLPDIDGLEVAERLQGESRAPILMLTARADVDSRVAGLYAGASDYLAKPFSVQELLARVHVRLREQQGTGVVRHEDLELDPGAMVCRCRGEPMVLPEREFDLLLLLLRHRGRLFSRDDIERALYGVHVPESNTVEVFVYNLRRKLGSVGHKGLIRTVRNRGYMVL
ncbi:MAG TPA: response regulator transcription factor [Trueperaceae bacterium]|nr:response regulator transcription factor [Trueperaceae bacterium]